MQENELMVEQLRMFDKQAEIELEVKDGKPYYTGWLLCVSDGLPDNLLVDGDLICYAESTKLPNGLKVNGLLDISQTDIIEIPDDCEFKSLNLRHAKVTKLRDNLELDELQAYKSSLTALPKSLKVKELLDISDTKIIEIPNDWKGYTDFDMPRTFETYEGELEYLSQRFVYRPEDGKKVGTHQGAHYFTKGQRKGLNVGGTKEPLFIIETDIEKNIIYTGQGHTHRGLFRSALFIAAPDEHWIREDLALKVYESKEFMVRIRYRQPLQKAVLYKVENGLYIHFSEPQSAITEGQFAAWYSGDELVGSGVIS